MQNTNDTRTTESTENITSDSATREQAASGCCGGPAPKESSACCALDAEVKSTGGAGCGCGAKTATPAKKGCC